MSKYKFEKFKETVHEMFVWAWTGWFGLYVDSTGKTMCREIYKKKKEKKKEVYR